MLVLPLPRRCPTHCQPCPVRPCNQLLRPCNQLPHPALQLAVYGKESMRRMATCNVLICGLGGLGVEVGQ